MKTADEVEPKNINVGLNYEKEYYKSQEENHMLKKEIEKYKEALLKICLKF